ncbi:MAG: hypothetical protein QG671_2463 [Actinomycetota bacterium]|nr:hypothetical protein [Actinomycetota bacterium]
MRVAHISDCYLPRTGGIELQVEGLAHAQLAAGHHPRVITATQASRSSSLDSAEMPAYGVPVVRLGLRLPYEIPVTHRIGKSLREALSTDTDVVHIHTGLVSPFALPALRTAVHSGLPVVVTVHSVLANWSRIFAASDALLKWRSWPVVWTAVSEVAARPLRQALGGRAPVHVLSNGIDIPFWRSTERDRVERLERSPNEVTIVAVGRLALRKRSQALIDILNEARRRLPAHIRLRAIIIGDGPNRSAIDKTLARRSMDWVHCLGWQTHDQIRAHYSNADIFVAPARLESFGIAALEARTFGLPVVAPDESGVTEFIRNGQEGFVASDDQGLTGAIVRLASDQKLRASVTHHNVSIEPEFGWPTIVAKADDRYREAINVLG